MEYIYTEDGDVNWDLMEKRAADREVMKDLGILVRAAKKEKERWCRTRYKTPSDIYDDDTDRGWMFSAIWKPYWKIANRLHCNVDYYDPDTTYEADILAHYEAYLSYLDMQEAEEEESDDEDKWWKYALTEIDYDNKYLKEDGE